ncbi:MAG: ADP-ribosylglycohydrolase family protein [Smithella sp.]
MLGSIIGDIIGSVYEHNSIKTKRFPLFDSHCRFTDDSVMTIATASALMKRADYAYSYRDFGRRYINAGYGRDFLRWILNSNFPAYNSFGNGSAMRVSPIGFAIDNVENVLSEARKSAEVSHNHPEGIKGAQAVALAIFRAKNGFSKKDIREEISKTFEYDLSRTVDEIRPKYRFDPTCAGSVPESIICFLDSIDFEDAIRNAVSLGGDSDTQACITGGIAEAAYSIPANMLNKAREMIPKEFLDIIDRFYCFLKHQQHCPTL